MKTVIRMVSSGLYLGYSPIAPGTAGSILGLLIYLQLKEFPTAYMLVVLLLFLLGFLICGRAQELFGRRDSPRIVIDEIASICLVYLFVKPSWPMVVAGFLIFRLFDIIKPPPARRLQALGGAKGIMLDDLTAAAYAIAVLLIVQILLAACR